MSESVVMISYTYGSVITSALCRTRDEYLSTMVELMFDENVKQSSIRTEGLIPPDWTT